MAAVEVHEYREDIDERHGQQDRPERGPRVPQDVGVNVLCVLVHREGRPMHAKNVTNARMVPSGSSAAPEKATMSTHMPALAAVPSHQLLETVVSFASGSCGVAAPSGTGGCTYACLRRPHAGQIAVSALIAAPQAVQKT